ncbi:MAG: hypothetical protein NWF09_07720 [Candidatus Bathyarchaeota archaeon]|nr:hypothetical protein [Candidatus Bathyarchaeota archaeon]
MGEIPQRPLHEIGRFIMQHRCLKCGKVTPKEQRIPLYKNPCPALVEYIQKNFPGTSATSILCGFVCTDCVDNPDFQK